MTCKPCQAYGGGTCYACRQGQATAITEKDVLEALAWFAVALLMTTLYLLALQ